MSVEDNPSGMNEVFFFALRRMKNCFDEGTIAKFWLGKLNCFLFKLLKLMIKKDFFYENL